MLAERAESFGREIDDDRLIEFRHINTFFLEIRLAAHFAAWIKLCRARAIAIASPHPGFLSGYVALFGHK